MEAAPAVGGAVGGSTEAEFDENDGEDLVPVLSSVLNALVQRDDKVCADNLVVAKSCLSREMKWSAGVCTLACLYRWLIGPRLQYSTH